MKKVVSKSEVAHLWANQVQSEARTPGSGSLFFDEDTIYSYGRHFKIAKHVTNDKGETAVLFTERGYSNTTQKHISAVRGAVRHLNVINVSSLDEYSKEGVFNIWLSDGQAIAAKLVKAKKPEIYLSEIAHLKLRVEKYANFYSYEIPAGLLEIFDLLNDYGDYKNKALERAKEKAANDKIVLQKRIEDFREFETDRVYHPGQHVYDYLRFNAAENRVETSQQVQIPADIAKEFYNFVLTTIANGGCNNCNRKLLYYQVTNINDKFITVGCHKIEIKEIKMLTEKLGW